MSYTSRLSGFYRNEVPARIAALREHAGADEETCAFLLRGGGLAVGVADKMVENVVAVHGLPLGVALNFLVNKDDVVVPMAVEEPSVVAAASNAARMVRASGGFHGEATPALMTAQVQFDDVPDCDAAAARVLAHKGMLLATGDSAIPRMVERGFGCRDLEVRVVDRACGLFVVHVYVDVGDAMGANTVDTVAEALAGPLHELVGGTVGLRILSNLTTRRTVRAGCFVSDEALGGADIAEGVARASRFADLDPFRAVTHNKGFMNGLDAAAVALGQDWRGIEAGAHAWAARDGAYRPLSTWRRVNGGLEGRCELPLAVGTVGGSTQAHDGVRAAFKILRVTSARRLAVVLASVGLASNLAALRALASEGIQRGHMRLHNRKHDPCEGAK
ncbi:MAG: hydroxymethylglutaryl-CoA reductase, degradative [Polyangiales bacterium]